MRQPLPSAVILLSALALACGERNAQPPSADSAARPGALDSAVTDARPSATAPEQWQLTEEGLGPLHAGMTIAQARAVIPGDFTIPAESPDDAACSYARWTAQPALTRVMVTDGVIARVEVDTTSIRTAAGAGVGDSEARIDSLYPGRVRRMAHKYTDGRYLIVVATPPRDTMFRFVFETDGHRVTTMRAGRVPAVEWVEGCS